VFLREPAVEADVGSEKKPTAQGGSLRGHEVLKLLLRFDMRNGHPLASGDVGLVGKILSERTLDVCSMRALPLDAGGVVRVHRANNFAQRFSRFRARRSTQRR